VLHQARTTSIVAARQDIAQKKLAVIHQVFLGSQIKVGQVPVFGNPYASSFIFVESGARIANGIGK
jgi:hypothetical protein